MRSVLNTHLNRLTSRIVDSIDWQSLTDEDLEDIVKAGGFEPDNGKHFTDDELARIAGINTRRETDDTRAAIEN